MKARASGVKLSMPVLDCINFIVPGWGGIAFLDRELIQRASATCDCRLRHKGLH